MRPCHSNIGSSSGVGCFSLLELASAVVWPPAVLWLFELASSWRQSVVMMTLMMPALFAASPTWCACLWTSRRVTRSSATCVGTVVATRHLSPPCATRCAMGRLGHGPSTTPSRAALAKRPAGAQLADIVPFATICFMTCQNHPA